MSGPERLFLVDGYALIYRAFYALITRPLRTAAGENTSASWGVANFLLRLREKYRPEYLAWVHDAGTSFREERYPDYKSTREKLDEDLQADFDRSVERICQMLEAFRIPVVAVSGYEADDVIGTLATRSAAQGLQAVIVSGDKDFYQLIGPNIALLNPGRGGPAAVDESWVDERNASERLGVPPGQVVDFLALVGDSSDNVPGVKGIGEKGAQKLLAEYGDLETLLARAGEISAKRSREALLAQADAARLSRELVTIKRDVPVELDLAAFRIQEPDAERVVQVLTQLEFYSLVRRLTGDTPPPASSAPAAQPPGAREAQADGDGAPAPSGEWLSLEMPDVRVTVVDDPAELPALVARLREAPLVALDTETDSLEPREATLVGLSFAVSPEEAWYLPFAHCPPSGELAAPAPVKNLPPLNSADLAPLREYLEDAFAPKAGHHVKYDWQVLRGAGVELAGIAYDSMLASFVLDPGRRSHGIDTLALEHLGRSMRTWADLVGKGKARIPFAEVAIADACSYCGTDAATVLALEAFFRPRLEETGMGPLLADVELPLVAALVDMEWEGIAIDRELFSRLSRELGDDLRRLEEEISRAAGVDLNINSPRQLQTVLFEQLQLPVLKKTKTGVSTDADVLEQLAAMGHELPRLILEYRELQKLKGTYVDALPARVSPTTGRIHTNFNQGGAATGRLSSSEPNLQNIPVRSARGEAIRRGFVPGAGRLFLVADYSQIELRLMAHLSGDPAFIDAFQRGGDIHRQTAAVIFNVPVESVTPEMRARAKTINFATIYGQGPFALSRQLGIAQADAKAFIEQYFERFAGVRAYLDAQIDFAREHGYVETIFGRRRYIPEIRDRNFNLRAYGERNAQNSPLQGSAADLIKIAMVNIHRAIRDERLSSRMLLQVHDELVFEADPGELEQLRALVREHMEGAAELRVPLVVDIGVGDNWLDAKR
ncbi:MAG: DNA polymerase I [Gemmatimonadota bacterium]|nr:DNA polymerase I [Gemmatimonadota bacterium]